MDDELAQLHHKREGNDDSTKNMSQEALILHSINYFHESLEKRAKMGARTALWTNRVIRSGILGLMLIAASIMILVVVVSEQMNQIAAVMGKMDQQMESVVYDMGQMRDTMKSIVTSVAKLPEIVDEISTMETTVGQMNGHIVVISGRMTHTGQMVEQMVNDVGGMDQNLESVATIVQGMDHNIDRVSRPFRMFNRMVPMP
ncbi:MAG: hypothetical protein HN842_05570 [Gammaproteobacteria bacterium]|jgi:uncharacterized protein YoxC|nr:hypothetical protein [Gammaproteobacteria bacterium]MBT7307666.1 hypothetical protein [Gammaproteobacteria bacterium]